VHLRGKDNRIESAEATAARRFGISEEAFREIERAIGDRLALRALALARDPRWAQPERFIQKSGNWRTYRYDNLARKFGTALRSLLVKAAIAYVGLLTETITKHRRRKQRVRWQSIYSQAMEFCGAFARWEQSGEWLVTAFRTASIDSKRIGPRERVAFLATLSVWPVPVEKEARKTIRHIALLAPPTSSQGRHRWSSKLTTVDVRARIARVKRENPGASIEHICMGVDRLKTSVPPSWKAREFLTWYAAWADPKFRNRVKKYISSVPPEIPARN